MLAITDACVHLFVFWFFFFGGGGGGGCWHFIVFGFSDIVDTKDTLLFVEVASWSCKSAVDSLYNLRKFVLRRMNHSTIFIYLVKKL